MNNIESKDFDLSHLSSRMRVRTVKYQVPGVSCLVKKVRKKHGWYTITDTTLNLSDRINTADACFSDEQPYRDYLFIFIFYFLFSLGLHGQTHDSCVWSRNG